MSDDRALVLATRTRNFRGRVLARLDDAIDGVRAYAEITTAREAVELLNVLAALRGSRSAFATATEKKR